MAGTRPRLPDGCRLPQSLNGWVYDPDTGKNAHAWYSADRTTSVAVYTGLDDYAYAKVEDERVMGESGTEFYRENYERCEDIDRRRENEAETVANVVEYAVAWMEAMSPDEWSHDAVAEPVFDTPPGFELEKYFRGERKTTIYYKQTDMGSNSRLAGAGEPDEYTIETCPYLYIHVWNGSGNATVALAPWLRAHGPGSKHPEIEPVFETPDECGLDVALTMARRWARETVATTGESATETSGQADLEQFA